MPVPVATNAPHLLATHFPLHICGTVSWTCRHCGTPNRHRVRATSWHVCCTNRLCQRWTLLTAIQEDVPAAPIPVTSIPVDIYELGEAIPQCELFRSGLGTARGHLRSRNR